MQLSTRPCSSTFCRLFEFSFYIMCDLRLVASCSKSQFLDEYVVFQSLLLYRRTYLQVHCIIVHALQGHRADNVLGEGAGLTRRCCQLFSLFLHRQTLRPSWLRTRCRCHVAIATTKSGELRHACTKVGNGPMACYKTRGSDSTTPNRYSIGTHPIPCGRFSLAPSCWQAQVNIVR